MVLKLAARLVTVDPYKIADIQEDDTSIHTLDLSAILPPATKGIIISAVRASGTGYFRVYPMSGTTFLLYADETKVQGGAFIPIKNQELKWRNTVANDDWDLILFGYFVQPRTSTDKA